MKLRMVPTLLAAVALISTKGGDGASVSANTSVATNSMGRNRADVHAEFCNRSLHSSHMWGDVDPNIYYICDEVSNTTRQLNCPAGRGFFNGRGYYGCIPYEEWPACIGSSSSGGSNATAQVCRDEEYMQRTWAAVDPNKFYTCKERNAAPVLLNCEPDKGYVSAWVGVGESRDHERTNIVGCAAWAQWRTYMQCVDFY